MKFVVAFLAVIAIGSVTAKPVANPGGLLGGLLGGISDALRNVLGLADSLLGNLDDIIQGLLNALGLIDVNDTETMNRIRVVINNHWENIVLLIKDLPTFNHPDSDVGTLAGSNVVTIFGIIKVAIGDIESIFEDATGEIGGLDSINVLFNDFLCYVKNLIATARQALSGVLHPPNVNYANVKSYFLSIVQFLQDAIAEIQSTVSSSNLSTVLVVIFGEVGIYITEIVQQLTSYAANISLNGIPGLLDLEGFLTSFLDSLNTLGLTCPN